MTQYHVFYRDPAAGLTTLAVTADRQLALAVREQNAALAPVVDPFEGEPENWESESLYPTEGEGY